MFAILLLKGCPECTPPRGTIEASMRLDPPRPRPPLRVGFVLTELVGGGAERSMLSIIDALDRARFEPSLVVFSSRQDHEPPKNVPIYVLSQRGGFAPGRLVSRIAELATLARRERFDLLVSFLVGPNVVSIAAARLAGIPVVIGERSAPRTVLSRANKQLKASGVWKTLVRLLYPRASAIVTNTNGAKEELTSFLGVAPDRVTVLPNPLDLDRIRELASETIDDARWPSGPVLVHVGRFTYAKDHDTLLRAFALLRAQRPATLVLVGDGEDEARVRALCTELGLDEDVRFMGFTRNPYKLLARGTLSVLTSRFEGLPNVLIESMAVGVPIVSTACQYGPIEIIGDNEYGVLVPVGDAAAFAKAAARLLDDEEERQRLIERGRRRALDFDRGRVGRDYEELFVKSSRATNR
jgi:glycosyltransferase involved in cell wall biosynthesis